MREADMKMMAGALQGGEWLRVQLDKLATVLLDEFGGPTQSEGAVDMAIRVLREQKSQNNTLAGQVRVYEERHAAISDQDSPEAVILRLRRERERLQGHLAEIRVALGVPGAPQERTLGRIHTALDQLDKLRHLVDDACAVRKLPDTMNDGGPADLAEEMRSLVNEWQAAEARAEQALADVKATQRQREVNYADAARAWDKVGTLQQMLGACHFEREMLVIKLRDAEKKAEGQ